MGIYEYIIISCVLFREPGGVSHDFSAVRGIYMAQSGVFNAV
jgi:hypothetical protein